MGAYSSIASVIINTCQLYRFLKMKPEEPLKVVMIGESAVGKSALFLQFIKGKFEDYREPTIGAAVDWKTIEDTSTIDDTPTMLEIWDTAGQES